MSYIGKKPTSSFASATSQTFTGNNSLTEFTLNRRVSAPEDLEVFVSNVQQQPTSSYTIEGNGLTLKFSEAPPSGQFYVVYRNEAGTNAIDLGAVRTIGDQTITGDLTVTSSDDGAGGDPNLVILRNSASPADQDQLGRLTFRTKSDTDQLVDAVQLRTKIPDVSNNTEDANLEFYVSQNGSLSNRLTMKGNGVTSFSNQDLKLNTGVDLLVNGNEIKLDADADTSITADTDDQIDFKTGGTDRMSIKANGQIFIGNTSGTLPQSTMGVNSAGRHIIANDGAGYLLLHDNSTAAANNGFDIHLGGVPAGTATLFAGGSIFGGVENGTDADGYFSIKTTSDGTVTERVRINSDGKVGIGTTDPQDPLHVYLSAGQRVARFESNDNTSAHITFKAPNTTYMPAIGVKDEALYLATHDAHERFRIKDNGRILIGDAGTGQSGASLLLGNDYEEGYSVSSSSSAQLQKGGKTFILKDGSNHSTDTNIFWSPRSTGWSMFYWNKVDNSGSDRRYVDLYWNGTTKGSIKYSTSGTIDYNTTSDYRLKDNIKDKDVDSLYDDVKKLKVRTFKFKKDAGESTDDTVGFIAHEVQEVFPQLCDTPKDAMKDDIEGFTKDADGNPAKVPDYQDLDYGKFTPFIIGALQKAMEKIETLEAKVKALEEA